MSIQLKLKKRGASWEEMNYDSERRFFKQAKAIIQPQLI